MIKPRALDKANIKYLRSLAHGLKPVVRLGQLGLTDAVIRELDLALAHHELVKIKLGASQKAARSKQVCELCAAVNAVSVQQIGHTATLYRRNDKQPVINLSLA